MSEPEVSAAPVEAPVPQPSAPDSEPPVPKKKSARQLALEERRAGHAAGVRTLDDVAARAARRAAAPREPEPEPEPEPEDDEEPEDFPVYTAGGSAVPPPSDDPMQRDGMTIGDIEPAEGESFPDTAGRGPPQNITDICGTYPIGNGQHFIRVERIEPKLYLSQRAAGYLGEIKHRLSERQFAEHYGGGIYLCTVYGPDPKGRHDPVSGAPIVKALTKPIRIMMRGAPVLDTEPGDEPGVPPRRMDDMRDWDPGGARGGFMGRRPMPPTPAEASIHGQALSALTEQVREERKDAREARRDAQASQGGSVEPVVAAVTSQARDTVAALRDELRAERDRAAAVESRREEELRALRGQLYDRERQPPPKSEASEAWGAITQLVGNIAPGRQSGEEASRLHERHRAELGERAEAHKRELDTQRDAHKREVDSLDSHHREAIRDLRAEIDRERERARVEVEAARRTGDERAAAVKEDWDRRLRDAGDKHKDDITRLERQHSSELERTKETQALLRETDKAQSEMKVHGLKERLELAKEERDRARKEADSKDDLETQIDKIEASAQKLGFTRTEETQPKDWKERLAAAASHALMNADKIIESAGKTLRAREEVMTRADQAQTRARQAQAQPPAAQAQQAQQRRLQGPPAQQPVQRTRWATDEGSPIARTAGPKQGQTTTDVGPAQQSAPRPVPAEQQQAPAQSQPEQVAPQAFAQPDAAAAPHPASPPTNGHSVAEQIRFNATELEALRSWMEMEIEAGRSPEEFAVAFVQRVGVEQARQNVSVIKPEMIIEALASTPATAGSPIVRRDGQVWFKRAWERMREIVMTPEGQA